MSHDEVPSAVVDESFRVALAELEDYLEDVPDERLTALVLPFASRWTLPAAGLDLGRLRDEADLLVKATPQSDRIVSGYVDHVAYRGRRERGQRPDDGTLKKGSASFKCTVSGHAADGMKGKLKVT